jgi:hypothetical protein
MNETLFFVLKMCIEMSCIALLRFARSGLTILSDLRAVGATIVVRGSWGTVDMLKDETSRGWGESSFLTESFSEDFRVHDYHHDGWDPKGNGTWHHGIHCKQKKRRKRI